MVKGLAIFDHETGAGKGCEIWRISLSSSTLGCTSRCYSSLIHIHTASVLPKVLPDEEIDHLSHIAL